MAINTAARPWLPVGGLAALAAMLAGCTHVPPQPVDLSARATARATASFDPTAIHARAQAIAPAAPRREGPVLDRLDLFAALLQHDPRIAQARAAIASARRDARAAAKAANPTLTLTSEYANDPGSVEHTPWLIGGALDFPLDFAGRRSARIGRAEFGILAARYDLAEVIWAERMAMDRALIELFAGEGQAALAAEILALRDHQLAVLEDRAKRGEISGLELYPWRAQRAAAARALEDAKARSATARAALAGLLGLPVAALADIRLLWPEFAASGPATPALSAPDRASAMAGRADVLRALAVYDQAEADLRGEIARQYPALSIGPGYTWERGLVKLPFALNLQTPSWDLNRAAIRAAEAKRAEAGAAMETALATAQGAIQTAESERAAALAALDRITTQELPQANATATRAETRLKLGEINRAEMLTAQIAEREAQMAAIDALVRLRGADAALEEAMRRPLWGPETEITRLPGEME